MKTDLPRYIEAPPGVAPDAYFLDGALVTPIARIVGATEAPPVATQPFPPALEAIDRIVTAVARVENGLPRFPPNVDPAEMPEALRIAHENSARLLEAEQARHEAILNMHRCAEANRSK